MKKQLLLSALITFFAGSVFAQTPFAGFYGQISTGYEINQITKAKGSSVEIPYDGKDVYTTGDSQRFGNVPLVLGLGYYWQIHSSWLMGFGGDYSALSQTSSSRKSNVFNAPGSDLIPAGTSMTTSGMNTQLSNRYDLFISPGYLIDQNKLVYLKAGYTQVNVREKRATSVTINTASKSITIPTTTAGATDNTTVGGYLIGLGYKQIISGGLYAFAEANYMGYETAKQAYSSNGNSAAKTGEGFSNSSTTNISTSQNINSYQFLVGLGYVF